MARNALQDHAIILGSASHEQAARFMDPFMDPIEELVRGPAINSLGYYIAFIRRKRISDSVLEETPYEQKMEPEPADRLHCGRDHTDGHRNAGADLRP